MADLTHLDNFSIQQLLDRRDYLRYKLGKLCQIQNAPPAAQIVPAAVAAGKMKIFKKQAHLNDQDYLPVSLYEDAESSAAGSAAATSPFPPPSVAPPAAANHHRILPGGQGKCLDGHEGRKVLREFQTFAATLMPHTPDTKSLLREKYIDMHTHAGGFVCVCRVSLHL
jgi:hypothetical protein